MKLQRYSVYALMAVSFAYLLAVSWCRWGDFLIDTFRDQWVYYRLTQGKVLYRDFDYPYGILPSYFFACIYRMFGIHVTHAIDVGVAITALSAFFIYRIGRLFLKRSFAALLVLNFLFVFAFNASSFLGIFNFILPYSSASTFFIMFALGALYCFIKFIQKEKAAYMRLWALFLYCAFLSRIEFSALIWVGCCSIAVPFLLSRGKMRLAYLLPIPLLAALVSYVVFLYAQNAFTGFNESIVGLYRFAGRGKSFFEFHSSGFEHFSVNAAMAAVSFSAHIVALSFFYLLGARVSGLAHKNTKRIIAFVAYGLVFAISSMVARLLMYRQFAAIAFLLAIGIGAYSFRLLHARESDTKRTVSLLALFSIAFVVMMRILLRAEPHGHGFFLLCPALIAYYVFCVELWPSLLLRHTPLRGGLSRHYFVFLAIFFIALSFPFVRRSHYWFRARTIQVEVPGRMSTYHLPTPRTERFCEAVQYLMHNTAADDTVVVLPGAGGVSINFLIPRDNPLRHYVFNPTGIAVIGEKNLVRDLEENAIDYLVVVTRPTPEHGPAFFGIDYGREIVAWIKKNYALEKLIGPDPLAYTGFGVAILKRKSA